MYAERPPELYNGRKFAPALFPLFPEDVEGCKVRWERSAPRPRVMSRTSGRVINELFVDKVGLKIFVSNEELWLSLKRCLWRDSLPCGVLASRTEKGPRGAANELGLYHWLCISAHCLPCSQILSSVHEVNSLDLQDRRSDRRVRLQAAEK